MQERNVPTTVRDGSGTHWYKFDLNWLYYITVVKRKCTYTYTLNLSFLYFPKPLLDFYLNKKILDCIRISFAKRKQNFSNKKISYNISVYIYIYICIFIKSKNN